jgi:hypothetical protein
MLQERITAVLRLDAGGLGHGHDSIPFLGGHLAIGRISTGTTSMPDRSMVSRDGNRTVPSVSADVAAVVGVARHLHRRSPARAARLSPGGQ